MHDIVGHVLNVMVLQAGAARLVHDRDPARSVEALATVETIGRQALDELDQVLGVLGSISIGDPANRQPTPGLVQIPALAERFTAAGIPVHVRVEGTPRPVGRPIELAAYRVVQEALTNVAKHAGGEPAEITVGWEPAALRLEVRDRAPGSGAPVRPGRGLDGISHRVAALGGTAEAGPDAAGGWLVRCTIPAAPA